MLPTFDSSKENQAVPKFWQNSMSLKSAEKLGEAGRGSIWRMLSDLLYCLKEFVFAKFPFIQIIFAFNRHTRDRWIGREASRLSAGLHVLDVGAGSCPYRSLFAHCRYVAHDVAVLDPMQLQGRKGYDNLDIVSEISTIPVADESFDVVLCTEVIEHVPNPIGAVFEMARILKAGGLLLLSAPLRSGLHQEPYHFYGGYTPYWYRKFLGEAGFKDIHVSQVGGLFKMYGESSLHAARALSPWAVVTRPFLVRLILLPIWLVTVPWFAVICPLLCHVLDKLLPLEWGTVGYHVRAVKCGSATRDAPGI